MPPDFIGIGAQKAATSWLYLVLKEHPHVWVTPTKELHHFNLQENEYSHFYRAILKKKGYRKSVKRFRHSPLYKPFWVHKYLFKKRDLNNYFKLFTPGKNQISGEITPAYARMDKLKISRLYTSLPKAKIIYLLRNPIERNWSSICMAYKNSKKRDIDSVTDEELIKDVAKPARIANAAYVTNLERWESHFPSEQIFIGFFDEIQFTPKEFLIRLFKFLELPKVDMSIFDKLLRRKINSYSKEVRPKVLYEIASAEYDNIRASHKRFNNQYTAAWLDELNLILNK